MRPLAYIVAIFHPKLSIKRLKESLGTYVDYNVKDAFQVLELPDFDIDTTLIDAINSIEAQDGHIVSISICTWQEESGASVGKMQTLKLLENTWKLRPRKKV